jgi:hypothetical protein
VKLRPVDSEMLLFAGYDDKVRILEVVYRTGGTYRYINVPSHEYEELLSAESIGQYMHEHIIGHYEYERV